MKRSKAFTLVEVLVASVILFSSLSIMLLVYKGILISSEKSNNTIIVTTSIQSILKIVREKVQDESMRDPSIETISGQGVAWSIMYNWTAKLERFERAPEYFNPESMDYEIPDKKFKLWEVRLELAGGRDVYYYKELSWNE